MTRTTTPRPTSLPGAFSRDLYFGYGSNLDIEDWSAFCTAQGLDAAVLRPIGPATLEGEALVFHYRSARRGCGALDIEPRRGGAVDGYLFEVDDWTALDLKEGLPCRYRREQVVVRDPAGTAVAAQAYRVVSAMREGPVPPNETYLTVCRAGRVRLGLSLAGLEAAARSAAAPSNVVSSTRSRRAAGT